MEHGPILLTETENKVPRLAYHKPFKVQLLHKREYWHRCNPENKGGFVWSKTKEDTGAGVYKRAQKGA